jgi:enamine deaminase RidA (YjgF/YER057c/UK114 family)
MERRNISSGSRFESEGAYSRVVSLGPWIFLSGCSGFDYATGEISPDVRQQAEQAFRNVAAALAAADARMADVVRLNLILRDAADYAVIASVLRRHLDAVRPTTTAWQAPLIEPRMKIEIEATAYRGDRERGRGH